MAPSSPTNLMVSDSTSTSISISWTASTDNIAVTRYDIYLDGIYNSTSSSNNSTITDLQPSTDYSVYIIAKDRAGNSSIKSESINIKTKEKSTDDTEPSEGGSCGTEDFEKIPTSNSAYTERVWTNRNITWTATAARTDQTDDNRAITIRNGSLTSSTISGGIGSLSVRTALLFTGTDGTFTLNINGEEVGKIAYSATPQTIQIDNINIEDNSIIELVNDSTTNRVRLDNLSWTCYPENLATDDINKNNVDKISIYPNPIKNYEFYIKGLKQTETIYIYNLNG
ncbi:fibronectin type III domain-containing protein [Chishuiella sp.]|uniref:fibronectin type III domain-containing protein n=1 Tax=Chishuiella sp. TaxID=1969467 RepID=UPI0028A6C42D|nr:fibronectin type III domain-containing protein [Chishuiella sp.]